MADRIVHFVHISDSHIGPTSDFSLYGEATAPAAEAIVEVINALPVRPDFVVHTGDIVASPDPGSSRVAASVFARLEVPVYYITGNHDRSEEIVAFLPMGSRETLFRDDGLNSYSFEQGGFRFLALDARGPDSVDPHGILPETQMELVRQVAREGGPELAVFIHFPPLPLDSVWFDRDMLLLNGMDFHRALLPARDRLRGVFFGHVHRGMQVLADGVLYSSVGSTFRQFFAWPADDHVKLDVPAPPAFNFVTLLPGRTIIKEHSLVVSPSRS